MKIKTINVYEYSELSAPAKKRALQNWRDNNEYFFLGGHLSNMLYEYLKDNKIEKAEVTKDPKIYYSLSYCQGDGVMFEGSFTWRGWEIEVTHTGRYYHSKTASFIMNNPDETEEEQDSTVKHDKALSKFQAIYEKICDQLEKDGYQFMEEDDSEENFIIDCENNERTFNADGTINNL
jgi:hypothetical protein